MLVCGTGTEVGKTWMAARALECLRASGTAVAARKPVQSFTPGEGPTDAEILAEATGERPHDVCPPHRWYEVAMAPPMAADVLGRASFTVAELAAELRWPDPIDVGLVETAGGVRSPIAADGDAVDLAGVLAPDIVLVVADAGLGTINAVRLSAAPLVGRRMLVVLNRFDEREGLHARNLTWLRERDGLDVVTRPEEVALRVRSVATG